MGESIGRHDDNAAGAEFTGTPPRAIVSGTDVHACMCASM